jgi:hypothetical protein
MGIIDPKQIQKYYWTWVTLRGECTWRNREREGNLKLECGDVLTV